MWTWSHPDRVLVHGEYILRANTDPSSDQWSNPIHIRPLRLRIALTLGMNPCNKLQSRLQSRDPSRGLVPGE